MDRTRLSLPDLIPGYAALGFPRREAVHAIVEMRMRAQNARGKGSRAGKRATLLAEHVAAELRALERRMKERQRLAFREQWAAIVGEEVAEGRLVSHHYAACVHE